MNVPPFSDAQQCVEMILSSGRIALLSGAGMSTSAGIPDFRGPGGLYSRLGIENPERIFEIGAFFSNPATFYDFYRDFLKLLETVTPTWSHRFFAALENQGRLSGIVTQNVDALHQRAGSRNVLEIHGSVWLSHCTKCGKEYGYAASAAKVAKERVPLCDACGSVIKPDIVFFGENVRQFENCQDLVSNADLLFVVGSSLVVTPAAWLPGLCPGRIVVVNKGEISRAWLPPSRISLHAEEDIDTFFRAVAQLAGIDVPEPR